MSATATTAATATVTATTTVTATVTPPAQDFTAFQRSWYGHTRSVSVTDTGVLSEFVSSGCCDLELVLVLQLSNPTSTGDAASADAEVIGVYDAQQGGLKAGDTGTVTVADGKLSDDLGNVEYCDDNGPAAGQCGA